MSIDEFIASPWKDDATHSLYGKSFLHMRPAPEYATGEVMLASLYRNVGYARSVKERTVPANGRDLAKRVERVSRQKIEKDEGLSAEKFKSLLYGALSSPKQPQQTSKRFLQICPIVPDAAMYSMSARLSANSWNPGELVSRVLAFGESNPDALQQRWQDIFEVLSVNDKDDVLAHFLNREFSRWRSDDLVNAWQSPERISVPGFVADWHRDCAKIPAKRFAADLDRSIALKGVLTRKQWISLLEAVVRLGTASHILWQCRSGSQIAKLVDGVLAGGPPPSDKTVREHLEVGQPFWSYGKTAAPTIRANARDYIMTRLSLNLLLWHLEADGFFSSHATLSLCSVPAVTEFLDKLHSWRERFPLAAYRSGLRHAIDENPRIVAAKDGIGSNIAEFLRHVLGQRQTSESGMDSYDQGYFLRKRAAYSSAPYIVSMGPVATLALVHCCTHGVRGPRTVEDFCRHLSEYGVEIRSQDVAVSDLGKTLRNLGLVLDSPDAEGGMVLVSPFREIPRAKR
jgi:hypothetical protein